MPKVDRFRRLPRSADDRWQGGLTRLPSWIERGPDGKPYRPWAGVWVSLKTGLVNLKMEPAPGAHDWTLALDALVEFGLKRDLVGHRPGRLEVADGELGARLLDAIGDADLTFTVVRDLPAVRPMLAEMAEQIAGEPLLPGALSASGVTVERMRAFADAAKRFYEAAPWRHLSDEDLLHVEAPSIPRGLRHVVVLGAGGHTFGLGFFESDADHAEVQEGGDPEAFAGRPRWSLFLAPITEMPFGDADLWEDHGLPVAADDAYPMAAQFRPDGTLRRPDGALLAYMEGLLRALAETTEGEIDQGRWTRQVETCDGPASYRIAIPHLLEPADAPPAERRGGLADRRAMERAMLEVERFVARAEFKDIEEMNEEIRGRFRGFMDEIPSTAATPLEKAQDTAYRAFDARGRRRIQLARRALELSPDCADAYVILAEHSGDPEQARDLYARGVVAGERALGPQVFAEQAGHFWGLITTRPYMRARFGLAQCLEALGRPDEAIEHYSELLRLNPNDNQGARYSLLPMLLAAGRDDEAGVLLRQFADEPSAIWQYGSALWTFRREGDSQTAREILRLARRVNRHVPKYLSGKEETPDTDPPRYAPGSEEEAVICAHALSGAWQGTPGAAEWLRTAARAGKGPTRRRP
jgi:tetratricopeptide (TPR) repeat protein